jgi:hypothetical protein
VWLLEVDSISTFAWELSLGSQVSRVTSSASGVLGGIRSLHSSWPMNGPSSGSAFLCALLQPTIVELVALSRITLQSLHISYLIMVSTRGGNPNIQHPLQPIGTQPVCDSDNWLGQGLGQLSHWVPPPFIGSQWYPCLTHFLQWLKTVQANGLVRRMVSRMIDCVCESISVLSVVAA